jgi:DNA-binding MarR family transcriptional regulator
VASGGGRAARRPPKAAEPARRAVLRGVASSATARAGETRGLDELLHHRIRLGIVSALAGTEELSFVELRALLKVTDGNLSVHARKLEEAGYIRCMKSFADRRPRTVYRLAETGLRALERYLDHMQAVIAATRTTLDR